MWQTMRALGTGIFILADGFDAAKIHTDLVHAERLTAPKQKKGESGPAEGVQERIDKVKTELGKDVDAIKKQDPTTVKELDAASSLLAKEHLTPEDLKQLESIMVGVLDKHKDKLGVSLEGLKAAAAPPDGQPQAVNADTEAPEGVTAKAEVPPPAEAAKPSPAVAAILDKLPQPPADKDIDQALSGLAKYANQQPPVKLTGADLDAIRAKLGGPIGEHLGKVKVPVESNAHKVSDDARWMQRGLYVSQILSHNIENKQVVNMGNQNVKQGFDVDGIFGPVTKGALSSFQVLGVHGSDYKEGVFDAATQQALIADIAPKATPGATPQVKEPQPEQKPATTDNSDYATVMKDKTTAKQAADAAESASKKAQAAAGAGDKKAAQAFAITADNEQAKAETAAEDAEKALARAKAYLKDHPGSIPQQIISQMEAAAAAARADAERASKAADAADKAAGYEIKIAPVTYQPGENK